MSNKHNEGAAPLHLIRGYDGLTWCGRKASQEMLTTGEPRLFALMAKVRRVCKRCSARRPGGGSK
jgi:hypothetical protein